MIIINEVDLHPDATSSVEVSRYLPMVGVFTHESVWY